MAKRKSKETSASVAMYDDGKWRAQDDMHTLCRAEEIRSDRARMSAAKKAAAGKMKELSAIAGKGRSKPKANPQAAREKRLEGKYL